MLVSYEDEGTVSRHGALWPRIPYWWGDQVKPEKLVHYLESMKSGGRPGTWATRGTSCNQGWKVMCRVHAHTHTCTQR